jgi:hypothetical protein
MKLALKLILVFGLTSCATFPEQSFKPIPFSDIEKLELGKTTKDQILQQFGKPNKISPHSNVEEAWIYDAVLSTGSIGQKASFSFNESTLVGVFWMPYGSDSFQNVKAVQEHFKDAKFVRKVKGWDKQGHSYSDDVRYYDPEKGISFTTDADKTVNWITFSIPSVTRKFSSEGSK